MMGGRDRRGALAPLALTACLALAGCQSLGVKTTDEPEAPVSEARALTLKGVKAMRENRLAEASRLLNYALKLDIRNSYLQYFNGMAYHLRAVRSDSALYPLAEQGYKLAIKFDQSYWMARYQLGLLHLDQRRFARARIAFADALFYNDSSGDILYNLAVSSYYAGDPRTAAAALTRLRAVEPASARTLRASTLVTAALGEAEAARDYLARYRQTKPKSARLGHLTRRLRDWSRFHVRARKIAFRALQPKFEKRFRGRSVGHESASPDQDPTGGEAPATQPSFDSSTMQPQDSTQQDGMQQDSTQQDGTQQDADDLEQKMVIVDVVIIASQEDISTAKGVNLLSGLQLQFGDSSNSAFSKVVTSVNNLFDNSGDSNTTTITRALNIPAITYALNIANSGTTRNEILARPSLVALAGETSEFFSGENIKAAVVSTSATEGAAEVEKDIGVKLSVTPEFLPNGKIKLKIEAERTFLQTPSSNVTFTIQLRVSKTIVNANVVMNFGETLILSGPGLFNALYARR